MHAWQYLHTYRFAIRSSCIILFELFFVKHKFFGVHNWFWNSGSVFLGVQSHPTNAFLVEFDKKCQINILKLVAYTKVHVQLEKQVKMGLYGLKPARNAQICRYPSAERVLFHLGITTFYYESSIMDIFNFIKIMLKYSRDMICVKCSIWQRFYISQFSRDIK
jgi:hypothetical protein